MKNSWLILLTSMILVLFACQDSVKQSDSTLKISPKDTVSEIYIGLYPSFMHYSTIRINRIENLVTFTVDPVSMMDSFPKPSIAPFTTGLEKYETSTGIKSFYDTVFTNSIKRDPRRPGNFDGISVVTVLVTGNRTDTIECGNDFPKTLSDNLTEQINFISNSTDDKSLKEYLKNLKSYFH